MQLHLKHPLEPGSAPRHAADIVATAADISGAVLDYSPDSIDLVEDIVDGFRAVGVTGEELAESLVGFGCYVGEILTRHAGGVWRRASASPRTVPLAVELPGAGECHPIDWVFGRLERGADVSIRGLYSAAGHGNPGGSPEGEC
ncbi:hypothetical protein AB0J21_30510 [Streptomyces sp. NPDC049954]|uniref:hypothetical protein n=1 Tax=Streptomyces sp. NPDC049954 TaxID=3155779 RepID=UPI0034315A2F